jgi:thioredoxin 1
MPPKLEVLEYWASWCEASRRMAPRMAELSAQLGPSVSIARRNADEADLGEHALRVVPTLLFLRDGQERARLEGERSQEEIVALLGGLS